MFRRLEVMTTRAMRLVVLTTLTAALLWLFPATVAAHAELLEATPADGATVDGTPEEISARFSEPLETDGSTFSLRTAAGERLAVGRVDPDDPTRLVIDPVPTLQPGMYEVRWRAASADGHAENDTWTFTVVAPTPTKALPTSTSSPEPSDGASPSAEPSPSATREPSAAPSPSASAGPTDPAGSSDGDVILPIIAALAIVLIAAGFLLSRRGRPADGV
jgi:methionine-rich copper-binding protein CopC